MIDDYIKFYKQWIKNDLPNILAMCQTDYERAMATESFMKDLYQFAIHRENINLCEKIRGFQEKQKTLKEDISKKQKELFENANDIIKFVMEL